MKHISGATLGVVVLLVVLAISAAASDPLVVLSAQEFHFGNQAQGTSSSPQVLTLANSGQADLIINSIELTGQNSGDFTHTSNCPMSPAVLPAAKSCQIQLVFRPRSSGPELTATLTISDNASGSPRSVSLFGTPSAPVPGITIAPATLAFGNQPVGTSSAAHPIVITNSGSVTLNLNAPITIAGPDATEFRLQRSANACPDGSGQIPPRASCEVSVLFAPVSAGGKSAQLVIVDDAAGSPQVVPLSGTAVAQ
jgi:hypothetical protein